ncbi:MAG TPA: type II toxin-antitoxin system VapC family toxin [Nocardioidaceae bacterium]|nr:type II toxin-antitoxin system VapC family toxin [Nocardioidaceae bacterium]
MSYLLGTHVVSELRKRRPDPGVRRWFDGVASADLYLSVLVVGELRQGVERLRRRDATAAAAIEDWLTRLESEYGDRIVPVTLRIAEMWGRLNAPDPLPAVDSLLAATALVHGWTLVSRNEADLETTGVPLLNPWG